MSVLTTTPLKAAPAAAAGVTITTGTMPAWGAWVEVITTTAAPIAIAGAQLASGSYSGQAFELDFGTGAVGVEGSVGTLRLHLHNSGARSDPSGVLLPVPLGGIPAGVRVAVRARSGSGTGPARVAVNYYETLSSDQVTTSAQVLTSAPAGTGSVAITPNATPWANSAWLELIASTATDVGLLGLVHGEAQGAETGLELDLGTGASGSETVLTTLRDTRTTGRTPHTWLPGIYPMASGTRVAVRLRKAGTDVGNFPVALVYYTNVPGGVAAGGLASVQSYVWGPL